MSIKVSEYIPAEQFAKWHEVFCATGGRYIKNPVRIKDMVLVDYEEGDSAKRYLMWLEAQKSFLEKDSSPKTWFGKFFRRFRYMLKHFKRNHWFLPSKIGY